MGEYGRPTITDLGRLDEPKTRSYEPSLLSETLWGVCLIGSVLLTVALVAAFLRP